MNYFSDVLLWLFVINLGISLGAGLYEKQMILPKWFHKSPEIGYRVNISAMKELDAGRKFWVGVTTVPLTLLTIANLIMSLQISGAKYHWWLAASLVIVVERIGTFSYFIPTAIKLMNSENLPQKRTSNLISSWLLLNYFRNTLTLIGWIMAMRAISLPQ